MSGLVTDECENGGGRQAVRSNERKTLPSVGAFTAPEWLAGSFRWQLRRGIGCQSFLDGVGKFVGVREQLAYLPRLFIIQNVFESRHSRQADPIDNLPVSLLHGVIRDAFSLEQLRRRRIHCCRKLGLLARHPMTTLAVLLIYIHASQKTWLVSRHGGLNGCLLLHMRVQGHVGDPFLERHGRVRYGRRRHPGRKVVVQAAKENENTQDETDHECSNHQSHLLFAFSTASYTFSCASAQRTCHEQGSVHACNPQACIEMHGRVSAGFSGF